MISKTVPQVPLLFCILWSLSSAADVQPLLPTLPPLPSLLSLPTLPPLKLPSVPTLFPPIEEKLPSGGLLSSLGLPTLPSFNIFSSTPCLGQSSLKPGKCQKVDVCQSGGGFADGKGLCLLDQVCCLEALKCGGKTENNNTAIASDKYPEYLTTAGQCSIIIKKLPKVVAIRIDFDVLELALPDSKSGECLIDALTVEGVDKGFELGKVCGINSKGHVYLPVGKSEQKEVLINLALSDTQHKRKWLLKVSQFEAGDPNLPPPECLQYFTETSGLLTSFNFDLNEKHGEGNIAGLKYASCIKKEVGFCKIAFEAVYFDMRGDFANTSDNKFARYVNSRFGQRVDYRRLNHYKNLNRVRPYLMKEPLFNYRIKPSQYVNYHSSYIDPSKMANYLPPLITSAPLKPVEHKTIIPLEGNLSIKPLLEEVKEEENLKPTLNETYNEDVYNKGVFSSSCKDEDVLILPPLDNGLPSLYCNKQLPIGVQLISSYSPFVIRVHNKGLVHGNGFAVLYKQLIC